LRLLTNSAKKCLDTGQFSRLRKGVDIVGDIAILKLPDEFQHEKHQIAERLLDLAPNLRVVLEQTSPVSSQFRTRKFEWLAGDRRTETLHREHGCQYRVDLETMYFSPRLSHERKRIADLVSQGECVVNFFAGVGSFSIMIAKHSHPSRVYSLDINPAAVRYHAQNNVLNRVRDRVDVICGDANQLVSSFLNGCADRVLLPLPELALQSLSTAKSALKNGCGVVHCYLFIDSNRRSAASTQALSKFGPVFQKIGAGEGNIESQVVRSVGPCRYQVCLDVHM
jgi:tRNA (guanine37-N1)-methyltransferase